MLESLDRVNWARLTDAYGNAEHVPEDIRALTASDPEAREQALGKLSGSIFHQGSRYRASAPAVPFLFEVLENPNTPSRDRIIDLLVHLAVGYPEQHLPCGFDPGKAFAAVGRLTRRRDLDALRTAEPDEEDDLDPGRVALWERDTYEAVAARVPVFQRLAVGEDGAVRRAAVQALAWFPRAASASVPLVRRIAAGGPSPAERANAILCLGILDRYLQDRSDLPVLERCLDPGQPAEMRAAAAISLGVVLGKALPDEALDVLLELVQHRTGDAVAASLVGWTLFGPAAYAGALLSVIRPEPTGPVVAALCRAAETDDTDARASVWDALLSVVFRRPKGVKYVADPTQAGGWRNVYLDPSQLTRNQLRALEAIGRNPLWDRWESFPDHHMDVCMRFGLPWRRDRYRALIAAARP